MKKHKADRHLQRRIDAYEAQMARLPVERQKAYTRPGSRSGRK